VLEGKSTQLIDQLQKDIGKLSKARRYEEAAELRNQYLALKALNSRVIFGGEEKITIGVDSALFELAQLLELKQPPRRIECYDISNFAGGDSVSSMVVFSDGLPDTKAYRHFKMRTRGPNDFAMMQETLTRRFSERNKAWPRPDLIIVDGGKGQLSSSKETLDSMGVAVLAVGLAKRFETLVVDSKDISPSAGLRKDGDYYIFNFEANSALLHLLQRVRDEAHRFAVGYHTHVRNTRTKRSVLDGIDGVGPVTRKKLIRAFGSVAGIKQAPQAEIAKIVGNSKAQSIISQLQR
jgi:excinuclease ABC subunit C